METFRSTFPIEKAPFGLSHDNRILLLGSCFTENMGARLAALKFYASINPFGIVYNPLSISRCLERLLDGDQPFSAAELAQHAGLWHGWTFIDTGAMPAWAPCLAPAASSSVICHFESEFA
ncbi:MAG TPA: GSCFA domain-containing protein [Saprospiraceae bacterium]|nr:GSCFA domain-containing protein [Saprospiraceae bacterium]